MKIHFAKEDLFYYLYIFLVSFVEIKSIPSFYQKRRRKYSIIFPSMKLPNILQKGVTDAEINMS